MRSVRLQGGFNLYEVLTRIVPGAAIFLPVLLLLSEATSASLTNFSNIQLLGIGLTMFIIGEVIDLIRENISPVPTVFRRVLYSETENENYLGWVDKKLVRAEKRFERVSLEVRSVYALTDREFTSELRDQIGLDEDFKNVNDLYSLLLLDLEPSLSDQTRRRRTIYIFAENTYWGLLIGIFLVSFYGFLSSDLNSFLALLLAFLLVITAVFLAILFDLYGRIEEVYVDSLITEFFYKQSQMENNMKDSGKERVYEFPEREG